MGGDCKGDRGWGWSRNREGTKDHQSDTSPLDGIPEGRWRVESNR